MRLPFLELRYCVERLLYLYYQNLGYHQKGSSLLLTLVTVFGSRSVDPYVEPQSFAIPLSALSVTSLPEQESRADLPR
jgi:hypothetical protein